MYSEVEPNNASWLLSNDQWNSKSVYPDYYDWLVSSLGKDHVKGMIGYAFKKPNEKVRWWTAKRNPEIGDVIFGGFGIQKMGVVNKVNSDGTIGFYEETISLQQDNLIYTESENINVDGTGFENLVWANDYDFIINTADKTFRLPLKTKLASGSAVVGNGMTLGLTDGSATFGLQTNLSGSSLIGDAGSYGKTLPSGDGASTDIAGAKGVGVTTDPTKSGIETSANGLKLYFYVGDVVQDASLINAGAALSQLSDKISRSKVSDKELVVSWGMPDYTAGIEVSVTGTEQTFICPKDGFVRFMAGGFNGNYGYLKVNDEIITNQSSAGNGYVVSVSAFTFVQALSVCKFMTGYTSNYLGNSFVFYPLKGVN